MKVYKLVWKFGKEEYVTGNDVAQAFNKAGIGNGALAALDYWKEIDELPDNLKTFEVVSSEGESDTGIYNPHFIDQLKSSGFDEGAITEIIFANHKFTFKFVGKSPLTYQYVKV